MTDLELGEIANNCFDASRDERLSDGMLYRRASEAIMFLQVELAKATAASEVLARYNCPLCNPAGVSEDGENCSHGRTIASIRDMSPVLGIKFLRDAIAGSDATVSRLRNVMTEAALGIHAIARGWSNTPSGPMAQEIASRLQAATNGLFAPRQ